jgi:hypothetical protein
LLGKGKVEIMTPSTSHMPFIQKRFLRPMIPSKKMTMAT